MAENLKITLVKSTIGAIPKHKLTVAALGLKKIGQPFNICFDFDILLLNYKRMTRKDNKKMNAFIKKRLFFQKKISRIQRLDY